MFVMRMFVAAEWQDRVARIQVTNPFNGEVLDTVPRGTVSDVDAALRTLEDGARVMRNMPSAERCRILRTAADKLRQRTDEFARTITLEVGKILAASRLEVSRAAETLEVSAEEAKRITGEVLPMDAAPGGAGKSGSRCEFPVASLRRSLRLTFR